MFQRPIQEAELHQNNLQAVNYLANLSLVARERENYERAEQSLEAATIRIADHDVPFLWNQLQLWRAELAIQRNNTKQAAILLEALQAHLNPKNDGLLFTQLVALQIHLQ